jgi:hypothetical protein
MTITFYNQHHSKMKNSLLHFFLFIGITCFSQDIPNPQFENWTDHIYWSDPVPFATLNEAAYFSYEIGSTLKNADSHGGQYCALLQGQGELGNSSIGAISIGNPGGTGFQDPIPFNGRPDSLVFWANYSIADADQGSVVIMLLLDGVQVGNTLYTITGSSEGYQRFSTPIAYLTDDQPNQLGFAAFSTSEFTLDPSSWIYLDDVSVIYTTNAGDAFPGGDFEIWEDRVANEPDGWHTSNLFTWPYTSVTSSTDAMSGLSMRIETQPISFSPDLNYGFGILQNTFSQECGDGAIDLEPTGFSVIPMMVTGYYKFIPINENDSATVFFSYDHYDSATGDCTNLLEWVKYLPAAATWTEFNAAIPSTLYYGWCLSSEMPTSLALAFSADKIDIISKTDPVGPVGNVLYIDNLVLNSDACWSVEEHTGFTFELFPNPANDVLTLVSESGLAQTQIEIVDITGRVVHSQIRKNMSTQMDITTLPSGSYVIHVSNENGSMSKIFMKE